MKRTKQFSILILAAIALCLSACSIELKGKGDEGTFTITIGGGNARTPGPDWLSGVTELEDLKHTIEIFDANGKVQYRVDDLLYGQTSSFSVTPGFYTFFAVAFFDSEPKAIGRTGRTIHSGRNSRVIIQMEESLGTGARDDPFIVYNVETLSRARESSDGAYANYKQIADIDLKGIDWTPIGSKESPFTGTYDGGGYTIANLTINRPGADYQGLFGYIAKDDGTGSASIKNINLKDVEITGKNYTGGIAGYVDNRTVYFCSVSGSVTGNECTGGVVGYICGYVGNSYSMADVSGTTKVGGVVGTTWYAKVECCYAVGSVNGTDNVGGIVGMYDRSDPKYDYVRNCVALNKSVTMTGTERDNVGRVIGFLDDSAESSNNYGRYDMDIRYGTAANGTGGSHYLPLVHGNDDQYKITADGKDGAGIGIEKTQWNSVAWAWWGDTAWWRKKAGFSTGNWNLANNKLPTIKNSGGDQNPEVTVYEYEVITWLWHECQVNPYDKYGQTRTTLARRYNSSHDKSDVLRVTPTAGSRYDAGEYLEVMSYEMDKDKKYAGKTLTFTISMDVYVETWGERTAEDEDVWLGKYDKHQTPTIAWSAFSIPEPEIEENPLVCGSWDTPLQTGKWHTLTGKITVNKVPKWDVDNQYPKILLSGFHLGTTEVYIANLTAQVR